MDLLNEEFETKYEIDTPGAELMQGRVVEPQHDLQGPGRWSRRDVGLPAGRGRTWSPPAQTMTATGLPQVLAFKSVELLACWIGEMQEMQEIHCQGFRRALILSRRHAALLKGSKDSRELLLTHD